jgi:hypothetical protein
VKVFVDHTNLLHYWHSQKVNQRIARYILTLVDYNIQIQHCPGPSNRADALSRRPDYNQGEEDNSQVTPLPSYLFGEQIQSAALKAMIEESQEQEQTQLEQLKNMHGWDKQGQLWRKEGKLVVISDQVKKEVLKGTPQSPNRWTSWDSIDIFLHQNLLLVAKHEGVGSTICQGMWSLPTEQS